MRKRIIKWTGNTAAGFALLAILSAQLGAVERIDKTALLNSSPGWNERCLQR